MADKKISQLTGATTPLGGTEEVPLVQSSTTKKVTVANLTAGRAVAGASFQANGRIVVAGTAIYDVPGPTGNNTGIAFSGNLWLPCDGTGTLTNGTCSLGSSSYKFNEAYLAGNIIQGTAAKGVNFTANTPAAGMTSQLLNWYEEGTWTPGQGSGLTVVGAFSSSGTYTRIGRQVTVRGQVVGATSVAVNAAGVISSNLPFTASVTHAGSMFDNAVTASGVVQITSASVVAATTIAATPNITFTATYTV